MIYKRLSTGFGMLVFFPNVSLMEFQVRYLALFRLFPVNDTFEWLWMGKSSQDYPLNARVPEGSILAPYLAFLMMLPVILLAILHLNVT